ncbi:hypothetical protein [Streptococcus tangpeifui]|uniref:hypothetical protein n=1 Tax=Streptococcus tangpeifui TaxID=2709400 RepID=UPI0013ECEEBC|nr:hypothetical protein [Streptococcus sp. ZJ373]
MDMQALEQFDLVDTEALATIKAGECEDRTGALLGLGEGALAGASFGATVGSMVPGVGTVAGALVGLPYGMIFGAFKGSADGQCHA